MLETALNIPTPKAAAANRPAPIRKSRSALYGYSILFVGLLAGWLLSEHELVDPTQGLGYWLGITGGTLMLLLLFYPAGKKSSLLRKLGLVKHWFRIHMIIGLVGPLLILYHCNFSVSAINSTVALYSMLAVAISGVVGRYFYTRIHRGLYGKRANVEELRAEIAAAVENSSGLAAILPNSVKHLHTVSEKLMGDELTRSISLRHSLSWTLTYYAVRLRMYLLVGRELTAQAAANEVVRINTRKLRKTANAYTARQLGLMRQVAQLAFYEKLFSLWHVFHMPLFLLLIVSALVHVLAVHMY